MLYWGSSNSNKPIVVNCGSLSGSANQDATNGGTRCWNRQIVPIRTCWERIFFVRAYGKIKIERPLIVAHEDNTEVFLNGATSLTIHNAGEYWSIPGW